MAEWKVGKLSGQRFNRLTVLGPNGRGKYRCRCDCGGEGCYDRTTLESGRVKSCGCYNREKKREDGQVSARLAWLRYLRDAASFRDIKFDLNPQQAWELSTSPCHYCGSPPTPWEGFKNKYLASSRHKKLEPDLVFAETKVIAVNGIDRKDPFGHYHPGNVVPCCRTCNCAKLQMGYEEFKLWVSRVYQHLNGRRE